MSNKLHKITANKILLSDETFGYNKVLIYDDEGGILAIEDMDKHDHTSVRSYKGIISPGFVNTHCHLELSHMKGIVHTGTGLLPFIKNVVQFRDIDRSLIATAIKNADAEMYNNGIVAVGDISNTLDTVEVKDASKICYYTFVEMFDFLQSDLTKNTIDKYFPVFDGQSISNGNKKNYVPHAPYSVSKELFQFIRSNNPQQCTISIHNQEFEQEDELFLYKTGGLIDFYKEFGMNLDDFTATNHTSIHYAMQYLDPNQNTLFVHNTMTKQEDVRRAQNWSSNVYWCTCPNANLYIENKLPNYQNFIKENATVTIGTDSLTSNWSLDIWSEVKTIRKYQSNIPLEKVLTWATLNGAKALGFENTLGSFELTKFPGIILLEGDINDEQDLKLVRIK